jgi:hypothetical protein
VTADERLTTTAIVSSAGGRTTALLTEGVTTTRGGSPTRADTNEVSTPWMTSVPHLARSGHRCLRTLPLTTPPKQTSGALAPTCLPPVDRGGSDTRRVPLGIRWLAELASEEQGVGVCEDRRRFAGPRLCPLLWTQPQRGAREPIRPSENPMTIRTGPVRRSEIEVNRPAGATHPGAPESFQ